MTTEVETPIFVASNSELPSVSYTTDFKKPLKHHNNDVMYPQQTPVSSTLSQPLGQQAQQFQQQTHNQFDRLRNWLQNCIQNTANNLRVYINQYPPLAAFLFTLMALSAVPLLIFIIVAVITSICTLIVALVGFGLVEGTILLASGGVLLSVLAGIGFFTTIGFGFISVIWLGWRGFSALFGGFWKQGGNLTSRIQQAAQQFSQGIQEQFPRMQEGIQQAMPTRTS